MTLSVPLSLLQRLYVYAIHGYVCEVCFTALWHFIVDRNWKLTGYTSIWILFIYGSSMLVQEQLYIRTSHRIPMLVRALIYTVWTYVWEFSTGLLLRQFDACPWDYEPWYEYHFMGLVTLEYAFFWYIGALLGEQIVIKNTLKLHWAPELKKITAVEDAKKQEVNGLKTD
ncbi:unnamed protein product [Owenia fusiformis]|uniref:Uncharacterized protein n=1 Tax=Owenia fusiformis TaxID=6347 RepID=A0A8J1U5E1_OWEFU|nr:unnamed protein product [Owenia fusiformis]